MADREMLIVLVRGMEDRLLEQAERAIKQIIRHAQQQEMPQVAAEHCDNALINDMPSEYKGQMTIWGMFQKYYQPQRLVGGSKETARLYGISVRHFGRFLGRPALLSDFTDERVSQFSADRAEQVAMQTVKKDMAQLLCMWRYAALRRLGPEAPTIRDPDAPEPVPDCWSKDEIRRLIAQIRLTPGTTPGGTPWKLFWETLVSMALDTGERIGALRSTTWERIDDSGWLTVPPGSRKGGKKGKRFKLSANTLALLRKLRKYSYSDEVFRWHHYPNYLYKKYGSILDAAGLANHRRTKFHKIRRTVATHYEAAGGDATALLGHSARSVTQAYLDERVISRPQPVDISPDFFARDD